MKESASESFQDPSLQSIDYTALERIGLARPVDRLAYLENAAKGKIVFDLGALDETAYQAKRQTENWLHARLYRSAARVVGFDNSALVPSEGLETNPNAKIINSNIFDLDAAIIKYGKPDIIIAGELIEHLPNTTQLLMSLKGNPALTSVEFIFSTPNACSWYNLFLGLFNRESTHQDHLQIYSYKSLRTLFKNSGLELTSLQPYHTKFHEMIEGSSGLKRYTVIAFEKLVNSLEFFTPILSGGWIGRTRI